MDRRRDNDAAQAGPVPPGTRVVVVEDEPSLRADLVDFLAAHGYAARGVDRAGGLKPALAAEPADIVVLDVNLPDGDGFTLARELREISGCGIVMLTYRNTADDRIEGLESGADAYLVKHASLREIEATIRSVLRRLTAPPPMAAKDGATWQLDPKAWSLVTPAGVPIRLTGTEVAFLGAVVEKAGQPCSRDAIIKLLARPALRADDRSLDAVVRRLRRKIEDAAGGEAPIKMIYGVGYAFTAPVTMRE